MSVQYEYDKEGETFLNFLLFIWTIVLLPATYCLWPPDKSIGEEERLKQICQCIPCQVKRQRLNVNHKWITNREKAIKIGLIVGWVIFILLAYKVSKIQHEHVEYDPYAEFDIGRGTSQVGIKNAYQQLFLKIHAGNDTEDEKKCMKIARAFASLTDEETKKNWEEYGNPDGPGVTKAGIAIPKWIVEDKNSLLGLALCGLVFMVIFPVVVRIWQYMSIKFSKDQVLLDTSHLYYYFFQKEPNMTLKKVIMVLAASFEFNKQHNSQIFERTSDNEEVPQLMKMFPDFDEKNKEKPLCHIYSVKARALLHSQFHRVDLSRSTLELDRLYVLKKCPVLINEMINMICQLVASAVARRAVQCMPRLDTVENVMKVSAMIIQGVTAKCSPLLQLPHITQDMLRHIVTKKRNIQKIQDLVTMKAADRRMLLCKLNDEEYQHVMNACRNLPQVKMTVNAEVLDGNTAGLILIVTVTLERKSMGELFEKEFKELEEQGSYSNQRCTEMNEEDEEHGMIEGNDKTEEVKNEKVADSPPKKTTKVWVKKRGKKPKHYQWKMAHYQWRKTHPMNDKEPSEETTDQVEVGEGDNEYVDQSGSKHEEEHEEEDQSEVEAEKEAKFIETEEKKKKYGSKEEDDDWKKFQEEAKKESVLIPNESGSYPVHCPYFPEEKQEGWWLYVADRKNHMLMSKLVKILSLKTTTKIQFKLKFSAPIEQGSYTYSIILRSDCYFDFDQVHNIKALIGVQVMDQAESGCGDSAGVRSIVNVLTQFKKSITSPSQASSVLK